MQPEGKLAKQQKRKKNKLHRKRGRVQLGWEDWVRKEMKHQGGHEMGRGGYRQSTVERTN